METTEMINLWKSHDKMIKENFLLNRKNAEEIMKMKIKSLLSTMRPAKIFTILAGIAWVGLGSFILVNLWVHASQQLSPFFIVSAGIQVLLTAAALFIYLYQLVLIHQVDIAGPLLTTQKKISGLRSSTLLVARILFLQLPLWTTFYLSEAVFKIENLFFLILNGMLTLTFTFIAGWLFVNIRYENKNKGWFKLIFSGREWEPILKSQELSRELQND